LYSAPSQVGTHETDLLVFSVNKGSLLFRVAKKRGKRPAQGYLIDLLIAEFQPEEEMDFLVEEHYPIVALI